MHAAKEYTMEEATCVASQASTEVEAYLYTFPETVFVQNVEKDKTFQKKDIDLIWFRSKNGRKWRTTIEVKGDRYSYSGNFFFETISNESKNTPGCFLYTEAHYVFYYFIDQRQLYALPMPRTRDWFVQNEHRFRQTATSTPIGNEIYRTIGRLVPRDIVQNEISGVHFTKIETA